MAPILNVSRRSFLAAVGIGGGGLVLGVALDGLPGLKGLAAPGEPAAFAPNVFLSVDPSGLVRIVAHRSEMGQGIRTSTTMVVADELEADWSRVAVVQAEGDEKKYGDQNTDGSHSIRGAMKPLRMAGASARMMLETAAAAQWKVPVAEVQARNHQVVHAASGRSLDYGALVAAASALPVPAPETVKLKAKSAFRYIGKSQPIIDGKGIVTGAAVFGIDATLPGMKFAVIARPPVYGGKLVSVDSTETMKVPGVEKVVTLEGAPPPSAFRPLGGVAVVAKNTWAAIQGREKLKLTWDDGPNASYDSAQYKAALVASAGRPGTAARNEGDVAAGLKGAAKLVAADYYAPHLTHSSIEPPAALADVTADGCRVWACTQGPQGARDELARALNLPAEKVTVHVTMLGGGFGRKSKPDFIVEAALLSKAVGAPVRVTWTREDEIQHSYYHTVTAMHLEGGFDASGKVTSWLGRTAFPCIGTVFAPNVKTPQAGELELGFLDVPYAIPNIRVEACDAEAHVRVGWFRSVSNIPHAFAVCSFADELAAAAKRDPKDFLLDLIGPARHVTLATTEKYGNYGGDIAEYPIDTGRLRAVIEAASAKAGWGRKLPARHGLGIAAHRSFLTYVCTVVEVAVAADGTISVPRVVTAIDCGTYVHADRIRSQMEGAAVMGVSTALYGQITFKNGRSEQTNFDTYELARMPDAPGVVETILIDSDAPPAGVGEPALPVFAPALCNAIFAATGRRLRTLPIGKKIAI
jgi:isoquinoline 1-oxidoreductase beta subunit